jgi:hypothetical protein
VGLPAGFEHLLGFGVVLQVSVIVSCEHKCKGHISRPALNVEPTLRPTIVTLSIGSSDLMLCELAKTATAINQFGSTSGATKGSFNESLLAVRVPVLSEQSMSTPASDSIAVSFWTIAFRLAR